MASRPPQPTDADCAIAYAKKSRPRHVTHHEMLDIILVNAMLRQDDTPRASRTAARLLRRKPQLVQEVWKAFLVETGGTVTKADPTMEMSTGTRLPTTPTIVNTIQDFVRQRRQERIRTVSKDMAQFLQAQPILCFDRESNLSTKAALRSTEGFLAKLG
ncbi:hypothetical protein H257_05548 [Aphanomyces astaci]|uniref:Uncharacterized protein n=1 Tax=Aphanomyces astaci TaxID=112090 RepID=W4GT02_APHAT|nr:hypothetical protein H257_05548 [Aphanomyces astaci]ETV82023.1 hypothetical protein H257_05548 [Aphanomyces astaci]RQM19455.1 hypothetical protein B5M09_011500 [Aphanomyces astaci]|eukprot:XP_009828760.1 hypothetical protein H257_05548 [Aphanomyces astaci]